MLQRLRAIASHPGAARAAGAGPTVLQWTALAVVVLMAIGCVPAAEAGKNLNKVDGDRAIIEDEYLHGFTMAELLAAGREAVGQTPKVDQDNIMDLDAKLRYAVVDVAGGERRVTAGYKGDDIVGTWKTPDDGYFQPDDYRYAPRSPQSRPKSMKLVYFAGTENLLEGLNDVLWFAHSIDHLDRSFYNEFSHYPESIKAKLGRLAERHLARFPLTDGEASSPADPLERMKNRCVEFCKTVAPGSRGSAGCAMDDLEGTMLKLPLVQRHWPDDGYTIMRHLPICRYFYRSYAQDRSISGGVKVLRAILKRIVKISLRNEEGDLRVQIDNLLDRLVTENPDHQFAFMGFSLGGAVAEYAAMRMYELHGLITPTLNKAGPGAAGYMATPRLAYMPWVASIKRTSDFVPHLGKSVGKTCIIWDNGRDQTAGMEECLPYFDQRSIVELADKFAGSATSGVVEANLRLKPGFGRFADLLNGKESTVGSVEVETDKMNRRFADWELSKCWQHSHLGAPILYDFDLDELLAEAHCTAASRMTYGMENPRYPYNFVAKVVYQEAMENLGKPGKYSQTFSCRKKDGALATNLNFDCGSPPVSTTLVALKEHFEANVRVKDADYAGQEMDFKEMEASVLGEGAVCFRAQRGSAVHYPTVAWCACYSYDTAHTKIPLPAVDAKSLMHHLDRQCTLYLDSNPDIIPKASRLEPPKKTLGDRITDVIWSPIMSSIGDIGGGVDVGAAF